MGKVKALLSLLFRPNKPDNFVAAFGALEQRISQLELSAARTAATGRQHRTSNTAFEEPTPAIAELLVHLPRLKTTDAGNVDFAASDQNLLNTLADNADTAYKIVLRGVAAMGRLMAHSGPEIEDGSLSSDTVEAIGLLLAELGELSGMLVALQGNCRRVAS